MPLCKWEGVHIVPKRAPQKKIANRGIYPPVPPGLGLGEERTLTEKRKHSTCTPFRSSLSPFCSGTNPSFLLACLLLLTDLGKKQGESRGSCPGCRASPRRETPTGSSWRCCPNSRPESPGTSLMLAPWDRLQRLPDSCQPNPGTTLPHSPTYHTAHRHFGVFPATGRGFEPAL